MHIFFQFRIYHKISRKMIINFCLSYSHYHQAFKFSTNDWFQIRTSKWFASTSCNTFLHVYPVDYPMFFQTFFEQNFMISGPFFQSPLMKALSQFWKNFCSTLSLIYQLFMFYVFYLSENDPVVRYDTYSVTPDPQTPICLTFDHQCISVTFTKPWLKFLKLDSTDKREK